MTAGFRLSVGAAVAVLLSAVFPADASAQRVALVAAEYPSRALDVRAQLIRAGIADVTFIDVATGPTPTLATLLEYDAVFTWSNLNYSDPVGLGNVLADYMDQGGGVVQAVFAFYTKPGGRWSTYAPLTSGAYQQQSGLALVPTLDHPVLTGVTKFDGGYFGFHHYGVQPQGCGTTVAHWTNGQPLVAVRRGPSGGRIVGLNMYPPSANVHPYFWSVLTDGHILMANAARYVSEGESVPPPVDGPAVALVAADDTVDLEDVECRLQDLNLFSTVDVIDARTTTPTAASLLSYDAVLTWADVAYGDSAALGNVLADYVDFGGAVVQGAYRPYPAPGGRLDGRWSDAGYRPLTEAPATTAAGLSLIETVPGHVMFTGVPSFTAGSGSYHHSPTALDTATRVVGSWSDGEPMIAIGADPARRIVGLNLLPPSSDARLVANTLLFAANHWPTVNAGSDSTIEATSAAGVSFTLNATASDVDGDVLSYTWSGAVSATGPSITIDVPPPSAPARTQAHTVTLTVEDGKGGETTDSVTLTVTDTTAPVLSGVPAETVTAQAAGAAGAEVTFGPVTAVDAVDGVTPVVCSPPPGLFPIGDTLVTCTSTDSRDNSASASFTVRVTDPIVPGSMHGKGFYRQTDPRYDFDFDVSENAAGVEQANFALKSKRMGDFSATSVTFVRFGGNTVVFRGAGVMNKQAGYTYEVFAVDSGNGPHDEDWLRIIISSPTGTVVEVEGAVSGGTIRSGRHVGTVAGKLAYRNSSNTSICESFLVSPRFSSRCRSFMAR